MKIERIDHNQLKITLTCTEMLQINLEMDTKESQNILLNLLKSLETDYQFSMMNHKIILEMIPSRQDGCNIFITKTESEKSCENHCVKLQIFSFEQRKTAEYVEQLIDTHFVEKIAFYRLDELYYLVCYLSPSAPEEQLICLIADFGEYVKNPTLFESVLKEYGTPLPPPNSLTKTFP